MIRLLFLMVLLIAGRAVLAQAQAPFADEITAYKKADSADAPPQGAILFVGSSSFRKWTDVQQSFPGYTIINRGFGGSMLPDVIRYAPDIIYPYKPKQVVIYAGDNDFAASDTVTAQTVFSRFHQLFWLIRDSLPQASVVFVAIKPSPSRRRLMPRMKEANALIATFLKAHANTAFVDVFKPMLLPDGRPKPEIFESDSLHMNAKGYAIWQKALQPVLQQ